MNYKLSPVMEQAVLVLSRQPSPIHLYALKLHHRFYLKATTVRALEQRGLVQTSFSRQQGWQIELTPAGRVLATYLKESYHEDAS